MRPELADGEGEHTAPDGGERIPSRFRVYLLSAACLVVLIGLAVVAHSLLRPRVRRSPSEFLPASVRLAIGLDLRPDGAAGRRLRETWAEEDLRHLADRATVLGQKVVDWTGLRLDLRRDAGPWFAGELVAAVVGEKEPAGVGVGSLVVIASASNMRRARICLDRAVAPMARDLEWDRLIARRPEGSIVVWRDKRNTDHLAYAVRDGCALISASLAAVEECMRAGQGAGQRLQDTGTFRRASGALPGDAAVWGYIDPRHGPQLVSYLAAGVRGGWLGLLRQYLRDWQGAPALGGTGPGAAIAFALAPEPEGLRIEGSYLAAEPAAAEPEAAHLEQLAMLLPRETAAYAILHNPRLLLGWQSPSSGPRRRRSPDRPSSALPIPWWSAGTLPRDLMVALLPRPEAQAPAVVAAVRTQEVTSAAARLLLAQLSQQAVVVTVGEFTLVASDQEAARQCRLAAEDAAHRLTPLRGRECWFDLWAQPERLSAAWKGVSEFGLRGWQTTSGGKGELVVRADPGRLLGPL